MRMRKSPAVKLAISVLFMFIFALPVFSQTQIEKDEALMEAVRSRNNDPALVERLLAEGADPNYRDYNGYTIANRAARMNTDNTDVLFLLAESGCRFDVINNYGNSPLYDAVGRDNNFRFILEWEQKNSPNFSGGYSTRKDYIASLFSEERYFSSFSKMIDILVEKGEDMNGFDRARRNPVWYIAKFSDPSALNLLRRFIAMGMRLDYVDREGVSPLSRSLEGNNDVFLAILRWENENSPAFSGNKANRTEYLASFLFSLYKKSGKEMWIRALLEHGADPNFADDQGRTALMYSPFTDKIDAVMYPPEPEYIRMLLDYGADPAIADNNGRTALHHLEFDIEIARLLIEAGADVNAEDRYGMTPLMVEVANNRTREKNRKINGFLSMGADPLKKTYDGKNLLLLYMESHSLHRVNSSTVELLMSLGINPAEADTSGNSALEMSLRYAGNISDDAMAVREMFLAAATEQEIAEASGNARRKLLPDFTRANSEELIQSFFAILPLAYLGISIWAREGIYRDNPQANWAGSANTFLTGFLTGAALSSIPFLLWFAATDGGWSRVFSVVLGMAAVPVTAVITGIVWASKPDYRSAFKEHGGLYYIFPVLTGALTIPLLTIIW